MNFKSSVEHAVSGKAGITAVRGVGTSVFIDTKDLETAYALNNHLITQGVLTKINGERGIAIKPSLLFDEKHASELTRALSRF